MNRRYKKFVELLDFLIKFRFSNVKLLCNLNAIDLEIF
jgi:hypothetical protein